MALQITPGPLPEDGARVIVEDMLTAFVQGTEITNFGEEEFSLGTIGFVISATDPPATDARNRGTMWFKRGEGKLYKWTPEPVRSEFWSPSEAGLNISEAQWVSISDRKDAMVKCRWGWSQGDKLICNTANSEWKFEQSQDVQGEPRFTIVAAGTSGTEGAANEGFAFDEARFQGHHLHVDPFFIAKEANANLQYAVVVEAGFVDGRIHTNSFDIENTLGQEPIPLMHQTFTDEHFLLKCVGATNWTNVYAVCGFLCDSTASNGQASLVKIFKPAASSNIAKDPLADRFNG